MIAPSASATGPVRPRPTGRDPLLRGSPPCTDHRAAPKRLSKGAETVPAPGPIAAVRAKPGPTGAKAAGSNGPSKWEKPGAWRSARGRRPGRAGRAFAIARSSRPGERPRPHRKAGRPPGPEGGYSRAVLLGIQG